MTSTTINSSATSGTTQRYRLVPQLTSVRVQTRHVLGLLGVTGSVQLVGGSAVVDGDGALLAVEAVLDMSSFASGSTARDRVVASPRFLDSGAQPHATYRSTDVQRRDGGWLVHGELTVKGTSAPLDLRVEHPRETGGTGGPERVLATAVVDRTRYPITVPTAMAARRLRIAVDARIELTPHP